MITKGFTFTHDRFRQDVPGVRVADSPFAIMAVTKVAKGVVYYGSPRAAGDTRPVRAAWHMDLAEFTARFAKRGVS